MLNIALYEALKNAFGSVAISNEDMQADIIPDSSRMCMWRIPSGNDSGSRGEQYHINCPFCKDRRQRLYINYTSFARPVVNGVTLPPGPLMAYCQNERCTDKRENRDWLEGVIARAMSGNQTVLLPSAASSQPDEGPERKLSDAITVEGIRTWVPDYEPVTEDSDPVILNYLGDRRITEADIRWLHIGCGPIRTASGMLKNGVSWVIFPIVQNGKLVGVQARCPSVYMEDGDKMKYYFHPGCRKASALFNIDVARMMGLGVVCEGVFDVASVGYPGVCCFGHTPSVLQRSMLTTLGSGLIWIPDSEANAQCDPVKIATDITGRWNEAKTFVLGAHVVRLPKKDAGEMTRKEVWAAIMEQVPALMQDYLVRCILPKVFG